MFCQITQHLLENHEMWKRVLETEVQDEAKNDEQNCISSPTDLITAIHEEEEEQASKEDESADSLDGRETEPVMEEEEIPLQSESSGEKEDGLE